MFRNVGFSKNGLDKYYSSTNYLPRFSPNNVTSNNRALKWCIFLQSHMRLLIGIVFRYYSGVKINIYKKSASKAIENI